MNCYFFMLPYSFLSIWTLPVLIIIIRYVWDNCRYFIKEDIVQKKIKSFNNIDGENVILTTMDGCSFCYRIYIGQSGATKEHP